jgi:retinol dehydrogenase-13
MNTPRGTTAQGFETQFGVSQTGDYRDKSCNKGGWPLRSPNPEAHDDRVADRLWDRSLELVGL